MQAHSFKIPPRFDRSGEYDYYLTDPKFRNERPVYSYRTKKAQDFAYAKAKFEYWYQFLLLHDSKDKANYDINCDLANGIGDKYMEHLRVPISSVLKEEGIEMPFEDVKYVDFISPVVKSKVNARRRLPLTFHVLDNSPYAYNQYMETKNKMLQDVLSQNVIQPIQQQLQLELQQSRPDLFEPTKNPEENEKKQKELTEIIQQGLQEKLYDRIFEYMEKEYRGEEALSFHLLLKDLCQELNLKFKFDEGYKIAFATAREVYRVINDYILDVKLIDPSRFYWYGLPNTIMFEDGIACMSIEPTDIYSLLAEFSRELGPNKVKEIENELFDLLNNAASPIVDSKVFGTIDYDEVDPKNTNHNIRYGTFGKRIDTRTPEGQQLHNNMMASNRFTPYSATRFDRVHLCYKENQEVKFIRKTPDPETTEWLMVDEHYTPDPTTDYEVRKDVIEEVWEVEAFGYQNRWWFLRHRPLKNQYNSAQDYKKVKLPYKGADFGSFNGNTKNISPIDNAKVYAFKASLHSYIIDFDVATDMGKVLVGSSEFKPKKYTNKEWRTKMKIDKFIDIDVTKEGQLQADLQYLFNAKDLSNSSDIAAKQNYLEYLRQQIMVLLGGSAESIAQISPYMPAQNVQNSLNASALQSAEIDVYHNLIIEQVLNALGDSALVYLSKNPYKKMVMLSDFSQAALNVDWDHVKKGVYKIKAVIDLQLDARLQLLQQQVLSFVQGGFLEFEEVVEIIWNPEYQVLKELARKATRRKKIQEEQVRRDEMEKLKISQEHAEKLQKQQEAANMAIQKEITARDIQKEEIRSTLMQKGYDVDRDNQNDLVEKAQEDNAAKERMQKKDLIFQTWFEKANQKLKERELDIKEMAVKKKPTK